MTVLLPTVVLLPLTSALLAFLLGGSRGRLLAIACGAGTVALLLALAAGLWERGPLRYAMGGWEAPLGIELRADGLSVVMLLMSGVITLAILVYSLGYFPSQAPGERWLPAESFWPLALFLWAGLNALFLAGDLFNLYIALELMTLAAVALVVLEEDRGALAAAMRYLLAAFVGSLSYLLGVAVLYARFDTLDLPLLGERMEAGAAAWSAAALITVGLALKTALFPLHFWLPRAHSIAPAPVSAALSALVVTAPFYMLLRLWTGPLLGVLTYPAAQALGGLGAAAIIWGSLQAMRQQRLKLIIAYSTVAQMGYLFLLPPLLVSPGAEANAEAARWAALAWSGGIYHALSHAFAKAAMFLAAGSIVHALGDDRIVGIGGIASRLPVSTYAFGIAGLTLVGLPPTGGFISKWLLLLSGIESGQWWWALAILAGGLLTAGYVFQVLTQELSRTDTDHRPPFTPVPRIMELTAMALALIALLLGVRPVEPLRMLELGSPFHSEPVAEASR